MTGTKRALVTGASSGIGRAALGLLVERGDQVLALDRNEAGLARTSAELEGPGSAETFCVDVTNPRAMETAIGKDPLDLVLACAGICKQSRLDEADTVEVWRETLSINLDGVFHTLRLAAPLVRDGGSIVVVSSGLGKNARAAYGAYCASKHAVLGLTKCAALELAGRRVRVNAVCPGWVDTPMSAADIVVTAERAGMDPSALRRDIEDGLPLGRPVSPMEVAKLMLWLSSSEASAITGQAYNISSGEFFL